MLKCYPRTGRTHQIRVHLKSIGHPIENDKMYRTIYEVEQKNTTLSSNEEYKGIEFEMEKGDVIPNMANEEFDEIYLHAYKYTFGKYKFKTSLPSWANLPDPIFTKKTQDPNT